MIALVLAALISHGPVATTEPALLTTTAPKPEKVRKSDTVCRHEVVVGSRMPRRICTTQSEWEIRAATDRLTVEKVQSVQPL
jgi:hypothetical protein